MTKEQLFFVFDVESIGLHGEGFAVGFVVVNGYGNDVQFGAMACPPKAAKGAHPKLEDVGQAWVMGNIAPLPITHDFPFGVREAFWAQWLCWKERGAIMVADCAWPVESKFLAQCVLDSPIEREWQGPYPLHDLASILLANGKDPLEKFPRLPKELPEHNPLADARRSARILTETLFPK